MDIKFKVKGFSLKVSDEVDAKVEEIEVEYKNFELKQIPAIIKETRKAMREFAELQSSANPASVHFGVFGDSDTPYEEEEEELDVDELDDEEEDEELDNSIKQKAVARGLGKKARTDKKGKSSEHDDDFLEA